MNESTPQIDSPWPHRIAVLLVCATFPLIWVGGLVTTYDAGMAVPDWPNTYGYNLFLYPWQTWIAGPWDLFVEHGHRLLGAVVGLITIVLLVAVIRCDERRTVRNASVGLVALVILQGALGGARVLLDERVLALIHGCVGPAFFACCIAMAVVTSRFWIEFSRRVKAGVDRTGVSDGRDLGKTTRLATGTTLLAYGQLVLGAHLRHLPHYTSASVFRIVLVFHLFVAAAIVVHALLVVLNVWRLGESTGLRVPGMMLAICIFLQIGLGIATWVVNYSWPVWFKDFSFAAGHVVQARSFVQGMIVTGHVAMGSLIVGLGTMISLRSFRQTRRVVSAAASGSVVAGFVA